MNGHPKIRRLSLTWSPTPCSRHGAMDHRWRILKLDSRYIIRLYESFRSLDSEGLPTGRGRKGLVRPDLNLRELCKEVGISHSHLSLVLLGRRNPSLKVARRLAEVLGISLDDLAAYLELYADQVK